MLKNVEEVEEVEFEGKVKVEVKKVNGKLDKLDKLDKLPSHHYYLCILKYQ